jgi:hypothetical protein
VSAAQTVVRGVLVASLLVGVAGCSPSPSRDVVADLERLLPIIEDLQIRSYWLRDEQCEYIAFADSAFSSDVDDEFCGIFPDGDRSLVPAAFDAAAIADLDRLKGEFRRVGLTLDYIAASYTREGTIASGSYFSADRCVGYTYEPGWTELPEDEPGEYVYVGLDEDWWAGDCCHGL